MHLDMTERWPPAGMHASGVPVDIFTQGNLCMMMKHLSRSYRPTVCYPSSASDSACEKRR